MVSIKDILYSDSISILDGKHLIANRQQLSSLTQIQNKNIAQFTADDNLCAHLRLLLFINFGFMIYSIFYILLT